MAKWTKLRGYGAFYVATAITVVTLTFSPYYEDQVILHGSTVWETIEYGSLWETLGWDSSGLGALWLLGTGALVALLAMGTIWPRLVAVPVGTAVVAGALAAAFVFKIGTDPSAEPTYTPAGVSAILVYASTVLIAVIHAVHASRTARSEAPLVTAPADDRP